MVWTIEFVKEIVVSWQAEGGSRSPGNVWSLHIITHRNSVIVHSCVTNVLSLSRRCYMGLWMCFKRICWWSFWFITRYTWSEYALFMKLKGNIFLQVQIWLIVVNKFKPIVSVISFFKLLWITPWCMCAVYIKIKCAQLKRGFFGTKIPPLVKIRA